MRLVPAWRPGQTGYELELPPHERSQANYTYQRGMVPFNGFATKSPIDVRAQNIEPLDVLRVTRHGDRWAVSDADGVLGFSRWTKANDGKMHAQFPGVSLTPPTDGWILVLVVVTSTGLDVDVRGIAGHGDPPHFQLPDGRVLQANRPEPPPGDDGTDVKDARATNNRGFLTKQREAQVLTFDPDGVPSVRLEFRDGALHMTTDDGDIDPASPALRRAGVYGFGVRGTSYYEQATVPADLRPGTRVTLVREPNNEHDPNAVAVHAGSPGRVVGYVDRSNAKRLAAALATGEEWQAIALDGSQPGTDWPPLSLLVARAHVLDALCGNLEP